MSALKISNFQISAFASSNIYLLDAFGCRRERRAGFCPGLILDEDTGGWEEDLSFPDPEAELYPPAGEEQLRGQRYRLPGYDLGAEDWGAPTGWTVPSSA